MGPGGAERQLCGLASMLARDGHEVRLRWFDGKPFYRDELDEAGVDYMRLGAYSRFYRAWMLSLSVSIHKPDVVIAFLDGAAMAACTLKRLGGNFRLIVSERNVSQSIEGRDAAKFKAYRHADAIVCNSATQAGLIARNFPELAPRLHTIRNFVDLERFRPASAGAGDGSASLSASGPSGRPYPGKWSAESIPDTPLRIVTVARTAEQKNPGRFVEAAKKATAEGLNVEFDWYGASGQWLQTEGPVRFHPAVEDVVAVYHAADALCLPSLYEGFPNAVCEAMACGLPVLCSDVCDNGSLVEDGVNGFLFDPLSSDSIAEAVGRFAALPADRRAEMGTASRRKAEEILSPAAFLAAWKELL